MLKLHKVHSIDFAKESYKTGGTHRFEKSFKALIEKGLLPNNVSILVSRYGIFL